jgi:hypothetical protein
MRIYKICENVCSSGYALLMSVETQDSMVPVLPIMDSVASFILNTWDLGFSGLGVFSVIWSAMYRETFKNYKKD